VPIQEALENMLEQKVSFVAAQCDIDHLKAYNEVFGYPRGDNLIKYAGIVLEAYCDPQLDFLGHVGGGNFTLLMRSGDWRERFATLVDQFNLGRQAFLAQIDIDRAGYHQKDRRGQPVFRDLPSLSIGAVAVAPGQYASHHEVVEAIANASIEAKKAAGGALFVERRTPDHRFRVGFDPED
jgi:GGDEF domain-containing protein